jgi:hypothetical protein
MEDVLEVYQRPEDVRFPLICFDETPVQLISETHKGIPAQKGQRERYDYEYHRQGTANLFMQYRITCFSIRQRPYRTAKKFFNQSRKDAKSQRFFAKLCQNPSVQADFTLPSHFFLKRSLRLCAFALNILAALQFK